MQPVTIFYSYAHADEALRDKLEKHLSSLRRQGLISEWHDRQIAPGDSWAKIISEYLDGASMILLLISPDFIASDYCYSIEMQRALERQRKGDAIVIPIILRPVDWQQAPFAYLQCLPLNGKPITTWSDQDNAFLDIVKGLRKAIEKLQKSSSNNISSAHPFSPSTPLHLSFKEKATLVEKLLACSSLLNKESRETIIKQLSNQVADKIERHSIARHDIMSIVDTCLKYPGSLEELIAITRFFEGNSTPMQHLDIFLSTLSKSLTE